MPWHQIMFLLLWAAACVYAAARGGAPERIAAGAIFLAVISTWVTAALSVIVTEEVYSSIVVGVALTDIALFVVLTALALASTRFWPIMMASMQGCGMLGHVAKPLAADIIPEAYYATVAFWSFPICALLIAATWRHRVRLKRYGVDYAWVKSLPRRYREGWSVNELTRPSAAALDLQRLSIGD